jgi:hypothetical protein
VPDFYVEQVFATPLTTAAERSLLGRLLSCGHEHGARLEAVLVDGEQQRIVCHVEAENLQRAHAAVRCAGLEPDATWLSEVPALSSAAPDVAATAACVEPAGLVDVIAERRQDTPIDAASLMRARQACHWCLDTFRVRPGPLVISTDRRRILAFFRAPDAEAVRACYRHASVRFDRVVALRRIEQTAFVRRSLEAPHSRSTRHA